MSTQCECVTPVQSYATKIMLATIFGLAIATSYVLFIEGFLVASGVSTLLLIIFFAPLIEEFFKSIPVLLAKNSKDVYLVGVISALSFGFGELYVSFTSSGNLVLTFTPFFHVLFQVPMMFMYGKYLDGRSKGNITKTWILGYVFAFSLHAMYNIMVMYVL